MKSGGKPPHSQIDPGHSRNCQWRENLRRGLGGIKTSQLAGAPKPGGTGGGAGGAGAGCELFGVGSVQGDEGAGCVEDVRSGGEPEEGETGEWAGEGEGPGERVSRLGSGGISDRDEFRPANTC
jgi:hypothetical protein